MWLSTEAQPRLIIIFRGMIFSTITISGKVIFILLYRTLDPLFSTVLGLPWWGEIQRENNAQPLIDLHEWKYSFHKNVSFEQFECSNWPWRSVQQITSYEVDDVKLKTKQRHLNGDTVQDAVLLQNRKFSQIGSNLVSTCSSRPN